MSKRLTIQTPEARSMKLSSNANPMSSLLLIKVSPVYADRVSLCQTLPCFSLDFPAVTQIILVASFEMGQMLL